MFSFIELNLNKQNICEKAYYYENKIDSLHYRKVFFIKNV